MPRIGAMYAGASGSNYSINKMVPGMANNKWQGIAPTSTMSASVARHVQTRAWGNNYDKVFCFNALGGGVGKRSNMFASNADGAKKDCQGSTPAPTPAPTSLDDSQTLAYLQTLNSDIQQITMFMTMDMGVDGPITIDGQTFNAPQFSDPITATITYVAIGPATQQIFNTAVSNTVPQPSSGNTYYAYYAIDTTTGTFLAATSSALINPGMGTEIVGLSAFLAS